MTSVMRTPAPGDSRPGVDPSTPFGGTSDNRFRTESGAPDYVAIQQSEEFTQLRGRFRRFVFPMTAVFLLWYFTYVMLAAFDHSLMSHPIVGQINVGLVLGLLQFISTILITLGYLRFTRKHFDPDVNTLREQAGASPQ